MAAAVRWLLVGPGDISQKRAAPALAGAEGSELVGVVYHTRRHQAEAIASRYGAREVFGDFDEALRRSAANAVYLATPVWLHAPHAVKAMETGRHVLVEKPLGLSAEDCAPMLAAQRQAGVTAGCAYYRRCFPRYRHAAEALKAGELGQVVLVRIAWVSWYDPQPDDPKHWRVVKARSGGGPLMDIGCHMLDVLIGLFGMPRAVCARCENLAHRWDVEDCASIIMKLAGGAHALATFAWCSAAWRQELEICGTEARLEWSPGNAGPVVKTAGREATSLELPNAQNVHLPLVQDFVDAVRTGRPPVCPLTEAAKTNTLIDAIYASSAQGREVEVPS